MRRVGIELAEHAADLRQFIHQARLRVQAPGGVGDQHIGATRARSLQRVEDHAGRIGAGTLRDHWHLVAFTPSLQLLDRGGTKRVAGGKEHAAAFGAKAPGEFADRGGLADTVDANHEQHERLAAVDIERALDGSQPCDQFAA